jgi:hypothetical protein
MRWRGVGAMGDVGGGGWGVGAELVPTTWSGKRPTLELSGDEAVRLERLVRLQTIHAQKSGISLCVFLNQLCRCCSGLSKRCRCHRGLVPLTLRQREIKPH